MNRQVCTYLAALALVVAAPGPLRAADVGPVKIAVVTDLTGGFSGISGQNSVEAVKMAVEDFGGSLLGRKIEVVTVDTRGNPAQTAAKIREAFDGGVEMAVDMADTGNGLAVLNVAKQMKKMVMVTAPGSSVFSGAACSKYAYHYGYDTYSFAHSTGTNVASSPKGKRWYAIAQNYAFGQVIVADFESAVKEKGGTFIHTDFVPLGTADYSAYLIAAKAAAPDVLFAGTAGNDNVNLMKQIRQFGVDKSVRIANGKIYQSDVDALPDVFTNSRATVSWVWNMDGPARAWSDKFTKRVGNGTRPTEVHAGDYSATTQWLKAAAATNSLDPDKIVPYLDGRQFNDFYIHGGEFRARDHRVIHEMYVIDVLPKEQLKEPHAWFKIVQTIAPGRAFRPESQSTCKKDW